MGALIFILLGIIGVSFLLWQERNIRNNVLTRDFIPHGKKRINEDVSIERIRHDHLILYIRAEEKETQLFSIRFEALSKTITITEYEKDK